VGCRGSAVRVRGPNPDPEWWQQLLAVVGVRARASGLLISITVPPLRRRQNRDQPQQQAKAAAVQLQSSPWQSSAASQGQWWPRMARAPRLPPVRSSGVCCCSWQVRTAPQRQAHYECGLVAVVSYLRHHHRWTFVAEEEGHPEGGRSVAAEAAPRLALGPLLLPAAHHTGCARGR
jgi:hypothetical protein